MKSFRFSIVSPILTQQMHRIHFKIWTSQLWK
jgi:hypothetical protein